MSLLRWQEKPQERHFFFADKGYHRHEECEKSKKWLSLLKQYKGMYTQPRKKCYRTYNILSRKGNYWNSHSFFYSRR
jgi:predicted metal-dependent hydrolase